MMYVNYTTVARSLAAWSCYRNGYTWKSNTNTDCVQVFRMSVNVAAALNSA